MLGILDLCYRTLGFSMMINYTVSMDIELALIHSDFVGISKKHGNLFKRKPFRVWKREPYQKPTKRTRDNEDKIESPTDVSADDAVRDVWRAYWM